MQSSFDISLYFREGWDLFTKNIANLLVVTLIFLAIVFAAGLVPFGSLLVSGPIMGGVYLIVLDASRGKPFDIMRIFEGFKNFFVPLVFVGILTSIFVFIGALFLIIPAFLVAGWYLFPYLFVVDKKMDFWAAMEASREIGFDNHLNVFLMAVLVMLVNLAGVLALGVGIVVSLPLTFCVITRAYEHLAGDLAARPEAPRSFDDTPPPPPPIPG